MPDLLPIDVPFNLHVGVETMLQCGGSCTGCVLSSMERTTSGSFDASLVAQRLAFVTAWIENRLAQGGTCESLTVFFGPGDHFLMSDTTIASLVDLAAAAIPDFLHARTTCFVSASAVGKTPALKVKTEALYQHAQRAGLPFFVQTVFDPQKFHEKQRFAPVYLDNIQGFRDRFGMTEIAINLSGDVPRSMSPSEFHAWMGLEGFRHVEFAWIPNARNVGLMRQSAGDIVAWLLSVVRLALANPVYEINVVPLLARAMLEKGSPLQGGPIADGLNPSLLIHRLSHQLYIDAQGYAQPAMAGMGGNQVPVHPRGDDQGLSTHAPFDANAWNQVLSLNARAIARTFVAQRPCAGCEWRTVCANHGAFPAVKLARETSLQPLEQCPFDFNGLLDGLREVFEAQPTWPASTRFDRNPTPWAMLDESGNPVLTAQAGYFQQQFEKAE